MLIKAIDLGEEIKTSIRLAIKQFLFDTLSTLPLANEGEKIKNALTPGLILKLEEQIKEYYKRLIETDVECKITVEDYVDIYLNRL